MKELIKIIRKDSLDYYDKYKVLKKDFLKNRRELKTKSEEINKITKSNLKEYEETKNNIDQFQIEYKFFKEKMKIEITEDKEDVNKMASILDSLAQEDVNIFEDLAEDDAILVSEALNDYLRENNFFEPEQENNLILSKINYIYNELYEKNKIIQIDIIYCSTNRSFSFGEKNVNLFLKDEEVYGIK